jgi:hypothetical protein
MPAGHAKDATAHAAAGTTLIGLDDDGRVARFRGYFDPRELLTAP